MSEELACKPHQDSLKQASRRMLAAADFTIMLSYWAFQKKSMTRNKYF